MTRAPGRSLPVLVVLLVIPLPRSVAQQVSLLSDSSFRQLGQIADTATTEHLRCGFVRVQEGQEVIARWVAPVILQADSAGIVAADCPPGTAIVWHTHVPKAGHPPWWHCALSREDVAMILSRPRRFYVVQVRSDVWCQWTTDQVRAALEGHLWPVPGQYVFGKQGPQGPR